MPAESPGETGDLYLLEQRFRYTYSNPVLRLRHRLMVVPRAVYGGQYRLGYDVSVSGAVVNVRETTDGFGNHVIELNAPKVAQWIEFEAWALVGHRWVSKGITQVAHAVSDDRLLDFTPLTRPDDRIADAAKDLSEASSGDMDLAERICTWSRESMTYQFGVTGVRTAAATALAGGKGVCQDYAHVMLAVCRQAGLPARYVSGHLIGEGGSHAWVEVVVTDPASQVGARKVAVAFDPTHARRVGPGYFTIAVGRDYADVPPTSGAFVGSSPGVLGSSRKWLGLADPSRHPTAS
ncbi:MAG: transglutaminase family protein [Acidimicrobiales bacterium]